jgi:glycosyltransferase involved in cell wall biosynthesis
MRHDRSIKHRMAAMTYALLDRIRVRPDYLDLAARKIAVEAVVNRKSTRVMFVYWGRRGGGCQLALQVARAALRDDRCTPTICISKQNEQFHKFQALKASFFPIETFSRGTGAISSAWRIRQLRRRLEQRLRTEEIQTVIELMPHVWSPFVMPVVRRTNATYCTIVHDAGGHAGDPTAWANSLLQRTIPIAHLTIALSQSVADKLVADGKVAADKIATLFHPDLAFGPMPQQRGLSRDRPIRLLFFGRIMPYKGLPLFLETIERLKSAGMAVEAGIFGQGALGPSAGRAYALGVKVINRWLSEDDIASVLSHYDVMLLSHLEASQSGVAAAAFGAGLPVVATPVGGLKEQVKDGVTGVLAARVDAAALADGVRRLVHEPGLYERICRNLHDSRRERSVERFIEACIELALHRARVPA